MDEKMRSKGQLAVWVVLAVLLVFTIILAVILTRGGEINLPSEQDSALDLENYLEVCTTQHVLDAVDIMLPKGGFIQPENTVVFEGIPIAYTCENIGNFAPCIHQHPLLVQEMKLEIRDYIFPYVEACFVEFADEYGSGSDVSLSSEWDIEISFKQDTVVIDIDREGSISRNDGVRNFDRLTYEVTSPAYNLALIAMEIADQEAKYCNFEYVGYNAYYPRYEIDRFTMSEGTKIYTITDTYTQKEMNIATRGCVIGPGGA